MPGKTNLVVPPGPGPSGVLAAGTQSRISSLHRKKVSEIGKQKEGTEIKRVNINVEVSLHNVFKATTAAQGTDMTTVLMEFIQNYVARHGSTSQQKKGRRA